MKNQFMESANPHCLVGLVHGKHLLLQGKKEKEKKNTESVKATGMDKKG
jgi:hypothetical protein